MCFYVALIFTEQFSDHYWCLEDLKKNVIAEQTTPITMNVITYNGFQWHLLYSLEV